MWSSASIQRPSTVFALPRYYSLHIFTVTVSKQPNTQRPVVQAPSSPKSQTYVRVTYLRTACVCFIQEEPHNVTCTLNREINQLQYIVPKMLQFAPCSVHHATYILIVVYYCCCSSRCPHNEVPGSRYYAHDDTSTYKRSMFCHTCIASHNTWLVGPAVGLRI